jgi:hypothetical protein
MTISKGAIYATYGIDIICITCGKKSNTLDDLRFLYLSNCTSTYQYRSQAGRQHPGITRAVCMVATDVTTAPG